MAESHEPPGRGPTIGIHASHEQIPPSGLLEAVRHPEAAGFRAAIYLHHVGQDQGEFIDAFGEHVLPQLAAVESARRP